MRKKKKISKGGAIDDIKYLNDITTSFYKSIDHTVDILNTRVRYINEFNEKLQKLNTEIDVKKMFDTVIQSHNIFCENLSELYAKCNEIIRLEMLKIDDKCRYENNLRDMGIK